ncbi:MFS transporter [Paracoccus denitrificans]|jgi:MFS family permease|uniref:MFS transporter n=1 Tax=Paracoccus denitrificans (strain Pd 1222) TaxID=318586 RepID=A1B739_PARDP|nr:MFS transporter [Paracoccus denitrificans]ABL71333.1 protein of unknown function DUF894, DitE [Paracoccus denitrificans PD1222]MBB4629954.1 MFS family permease [Paracoccus denitrificans]MCU7431317.1 MFS transporter [Paracoccus denitrificans]UPV97676.1 MFS transporter [Paracoccus denitrificans]WQO35590.1 MFS transporter [Paracoccus denitrificans]
MSQTLAVFRNRTFRGLWLGTVASNMGGLVQQVGAAWLMATMTSSATMIALVQACVTLPIMLGSYPAGVLADCRDRRRIMQVAQIFMAVVSAALAVLAWMGQVTPVVLLVFTALVGCGTALQFPAWQSSIGGLVVRDELPAAISANAMGTNLTRSLGPALGGAIVAAAGSAMAFAVNALSYLAVIVALWRWRPARSENDLPAESLFPAMRAGVVYCLSSGDKLGAIWRGFLFCLAAIGVQALLPALVRDEIAGGASIYGIMLGAFGAGAVGAALVSTRLRARYGLETTCRLGFVAFALAVAALAIAPGLGLGIAALLVCGAAWLTVLSLVNISIQVSTPKWVLGRMMAIYMTAIFGGMTLGSWLWGYVSTLGGLHLALLLSAGLLLLGAAWGLWAPLVAAEPDSILPAELPASPQPRVALGHDSGPVRISVEYVIPVEREGSFLTVMEARRRSRARSGVSNWSLYHDVEAPSQWIETYGFATWGDYLRQRARKTRQDEAIIAQLHALHHGDHPPQVRRIVGTRRPQTLRAPPLP